MSVFSTEPALLGSVAIYDRHPPASSAPDRLRTWGVAITDCGVPGAALPSLDVASVAQSHAQLYFSIWYGIAAFASGTLRYAGGVHPPAAIRAAQSETPAVPASGPPVGC